MKFLYLRHGKTEFSAKNQFMGRCDLPLLSKDRKEFQKAIALIEVWRPSKVYYSPLLRAVETKNIILDAVDIAQVIENEYLIERDFGSLEGKEKNDNNRKKIEYCSSAESKNSFRERISKFLSMIETESDESILIVGHSSFYREMVQLILNADNHENIECCEVKVINTQ